MIDIDKMVSEFRKMVYEPEHEPVMCWCIPSFVKNDEGKLEIIHYSQRDTLSKFFEEKLRACVNQKATQS